MEGLSFSKWLGPDGIEQFITNQTGCKPCSGPGIFTNKAKTISILKSVDGTYYYDDDMRDIQNVKYTLFGHNGDQNENETQFNKPLLNQTQNIYLYRVKIIGREKEYIWYGKYEIVGKNNKLHIGEDRVMRNIIILSLKKIDY